MKPTGVSNCSFNSQRDLPSLLSLFVQSSHASWEKPTAQSTLLLAAGGKPAVDPRIA